MALTIQKSPDSYSPVYNDMMFLVSSTNTAQANFYIKVYVDYFPAGSPVNIFEGNVFPKPGKIYIEFDPSRILRGAIDGVAVLNNDFDILIGATTTGQVSSVGHNYRVRFQEYYGSTPTAQGTEAISSTKYRFLASLGRREFARYDENDYVINSTQLAKFLTNASQIWVRDADTILLNVMSKTTGGTALFTKLIVEKFDYAGASMGTSDITMLSPESSESNRFQAVRCGPLQVGAASDVQYMDIWAASAANVQRTEKLRVWIDRECYKYESQVVYWVNRFGGIDMMNFQLVSRNIMDVDRKRYNRPVGESTDAYAYNLNSYDTETATFSTKIKNRLVLNTAYLNDYQTEMLKDFVSSSSIWWYDSENEEFVFMQMERSSYETKKAINEGLIQEEFTLVESLENERQRC